MKDRLLNFLMLLTVAAALILTYVKGSPGKAPLSSTPAVTALPTVHPVTAYRQEREKTRAQEREALEGIRSSGASSAETAALADETLRDMLRADENELAVEAVLAARGYANALCVYRRGTLTVLTDRKLTETDARLILDLARDAAGISEERVRISGF